MTVVNYIILFYLFFFVFLFDFLFSFIFAFVFDLFFVEKRAAVHLIKKAGPKRTKQKSSLQELVFDILFFSLNCTNLHRHQLPSMVYNKVSLHIKL